MYYSRKSPRIPKYDYSAENYYFITICAHNHRCVFGTIQEKSKIGLIAEEHIESLPSHYSQIQVDKFVVMPNHIHMILILNKSGEVRVDQIIGQFKSGVTREIRRFYPDVQLWQRSFHDHVIRNQKEYEAIWMYIEGNPSCWEKDCFFTDIG